MIRRRAVAGERGRLGRRRRRQQRCGAQPQLREYGLTRREYDILRRVATGEINREIATALGLTRKTVKIYLQRALEKLGTRNRVEALARANQLGIL